MNSSDAPALFDSGHTLEQIDGVLEEFVGHATPGELRFDDPSLEVALEFGLLEGDVIETSEAGTVMLAEPWHIIDRVTAVRNAIARGSALSEAIEQANLAVAPRRA